MTIPPRTLASARSRHLLAYLVVACLLLTACVAAGARWLHGEDGREWLARTIERAFDGRARGTLRIGRIDAIHGFSVEATDVLFRDPGGHDVIAIRDARVGADPFDLALGRIRLRDAVARGVVVRIVPGRRHTTSIEDVFEGSSASSEPTDLDTRSIDVRHARVVLALGGAPVELHSLRGFVRVALPAGGLVRVRLDEFHGRFDLPHFGLFRARDFRTSGWVRAGSRPVAEFHLRACLPAGMMPMRIQYSPGDLAIRFDARENRIAGLILGAVATFSPTIRSSRGRVSVATIHRC